MNLKALADRGVWQTGTRPTKEVHRPWRSLLRPPKCLCCASSAPSSGRRPDARVASGRHGRGPRRRCAPPSTGAAASGSCFSAIARRSSGGGRDVERQRLIAQRLGSLGAFRRSSLRRGWNTSASASSTRDADGTYVGRHISSTLSTGWSMRATMIRAASTAAKFCTIRIPSHVALILEPGTPRSV